MKILSSVAVLAMLVCACNVPVPGSTDQVTGEVAGELQSQTNTPPSATTGDGGQAPDSPMVPPSLLQMISPGTTSPEPGSTSVDPAPQPDPAAGVTPAPEPTPGDPPP